MANYVKSIQEDLKDKAIKLGKKGVIRDSAFIFENIADNFHPKSYENIVTGKNDWDTRLTKIHTQLGGNGFEMQSSNSSDALLMNIFCHPMIKEWKGIRDLLNIEKDDDIIFGWKNAGFENERRAKTEVDMRIGDNLFEAKLTESDFTKKELSIVLNYNQVLDVFDIDKLKVNEDKVKNYQLIRNILAAKKHNCRFKVILDARRTDLIRDFMVTIDAVKDDKLRSKISFVTWQEITSLCGDDLREYLEDKYFARNR